MFSYINPSASPETYLRDPSRGAMGLGLSFASQMRRYRSIMALAGKVRLRAAGGR